MATLKIIATRLKSVTNIQKITKSMKMVSAAKFSRAEKELKGARPQGEGAQTFFDRAQVSKFEVKSETGAQKLLVAITSDKGLCGAVHTQVSKSIKTELGNTPGQTKIVCIGDKSRSLLQSMYANNIVLVVSNLGRLPPTFVDASRIAVTISKFDFSVGKIYYNKFKSIVSYSVTNIPLYSENAVLNAPKSVIYDSLESDVLESYLEFTLATLVYYTLKENACSEQASRMSAMDNASKNAGEMINALTLKLNRTRQAAITRELTEIISGAAALE